jgi:hypothetical protein
LEETEYKKLKDRQLVSKISSKGDLDSSIRGNIETNLDGIGNFMRLQRNDSGHPTGTKKSRDEMFVNLRLFVPYCKQICDLLDWLQQKCANGTKIF